MTVGIRLNIREEVPEGYGVDGGVELAQYFESTGLIDYVHGVVGSPWGNPSYIQPTYFEPGPVRVARRRAKRAVSLPVVHTGRITDPDVAERVLADGQRRHRRASREPTSPTGTCCARRVRDAPPRSGPVSAATSASAAAMSRGCPSAVRSTRTPATRSTHPGRRCGSRAGSWSSVAVRPGMELAALGRENGFEVDLWEAEQELGGQLRYVVQAPRHEGYAKYLRWQTERLDSLGVKVELGSTSQRGRHPRSRRRHRRHRHRRRARRPQIPGVDADHVLDIRDVLAGRVVPGHRVLVVAQDDHVAPLSVADFLAGQGRQVSVVYATHQPAPLLGRYIIGGILGRLDEQDVKLHFMEEVRRIDRHTVDVRNVYSWRTRELGEFDSVVLACGSVSESGLYDELRDRAPRHPCARRRLRPPAAGLRHPSGLRPG